MIDFNGLSIKKDSDIKVLEKAMHEEVIYDINNYYLKDSDIPFYFNKDEIEKTLKILREQTLLFKKRRKK